MNSRPPVRIPKHLQPWVDVRRRFRLTDTHVQMARELGLNPEKFGKKANPENPSWKGPLPQYIEDLYKKKFGREWPVAVRTIEEKVQRAAEKKAAKKAAKLLAKKQAGEKPHAKPADESKPDE